MKPSLKGSLLGVGAAVATAFLSVGADAKCMSCSGGGRALYVGQKFVPTGAKVLQAQLAELGGGNFIPTSQLYRNSRLLKNEGASGSGGQGGGSGGNSGSGNATTTVDTGSTDDGDVVSGSNHHGGGADDNNGLGNAFGTGDFAERFGFNETTLGPGASWLPEDLKANITALLTSIGQTRHSGGGDDDCDGLLGIACSSNTTDTGAGGGSDAPVLGGGGGPGSGNSTEARKKKEDRENSNQALAKELRKAAADAMKALRQSNDTATLDDQDRVSFNFSSPDGTFHLKSFNTRSQAAEHALPVLLRVASHHVELASRIAGAGNDSFALVGARPFNPHSFSSTKSTSNTTLTVVSDVLEVSVVDGDGNEVPVNETSTSNTQSGTPSDDTTPAVNFTIVVEGYTDPVSQPPVCSYWDETDLAWKTDGCTLVGVNASAEDNSTAVSCECTHLTDFAVSVSSSTELIMAPGGGDQQQGAGGSTALSGGAIAGIVVGLVALAAISVFAVIALKRRRRDVDMQSPAGSTTSSATSVSPNNSNQQQAATAPSASRKVVRTPSDVA